MTKPSDKTTEETTLEGLDHLKTITCTKPGPYSGIRLLRPESEGVEPPYKDTYVRTIKVRTPK